MEKIFVRQVRSTSNSKPQHVATLKALGLGRRGQCNLIGDSKAVRGMIRSVVQWVEVKHV
jgi:ribosomal protein L30